FSSFFVGQLQDGDLNIDTRPVKGSGVDAAPDIPLSKVDRIPPGHQAFFSVGSESGTRYRILAVRLPNSAVTNVYGTPRNDVDDVIRRLIWVEIAATAAIVAVLGLVTYWVVRLGVNPIKRMTRTASGIAAGDLSQRVPDEVPGTEAGELGLALNGMLGRIEE